MHAINIDTDLREEATALMWDAELTKKEAVALVLFNRGYTHSAIADVQGVSLPMVNKRLTSARRKTAEAGGCIS